MKLQAIAAILAGTLVLAPRPASACAMKSNEVVIVLGTVARELVVVRIAFGEDDTAPETFKTSWSGGAQSDVVVVLAQPQP